MGKHGDITDEFDDDALRQSIETASSKGAWKNEEGFEDPKLKEIAQKLATAPIENYAERRLRELQQRTAKKEQTLAKPAEPQRFAEEPLFRESPDEWRERVVPPPAKAAAAMPAGPFAPTGADTLPTGPVTPTPKGAIAHTPSAGAAIRSWLRPLAAAGLTFGLAAATHAAVTDWAANQVVRASLAAVVAAIAWRQLEVGRFGAAVSGAGLYVAAFGTTAAIGNPSHQFGMFLGVLVTTVGGFVTGFAAEARRAAGYRPAVRTADEPPVKPC